MSEPCKPCQKVVAAVVAVVTEHGRADPEVIEARRAVCRGCDYAVPCPSPWGHLKCICSACSCVILFKTMVASEECPHRFWPSA
jgi:hypothetical protein